MDAETVRWAIVYRAGGPRRPAEVWAVITGVPADVKQAEVTEAVQAWHKWPSWHSRIGIGGHVAITPEKRWPKGVAEYVDGDDGWPPARTVWLTWDQLAPTVRRVTAPLDSRLYAAVGRAARARGLSINQWAAEALAAAVALQEADSDG